jgi:hypothetical protein
MTSSVSWVIFTCLDYSKNNKMNEWMNEFINYPILRKPQGMLYAATDFAFYSWTVTAIARTESNTYFHPFVFLI